MAGRNFWPEDNDLHGRWQEYGAARTVEPGTVARRDPGRTGDRSPRAELPAGGYQRRDAEGRRAYDPGDLPRAGMTGQRGLPEGVADEVATPFDEDTILDYVERTHRGRGPRGYRRSDERIREDIGDRLTDDPWLDASEIEVTVQNGEVTLGGTVDSRSARRRAEDLAESVRGVGYVQNNLRARDPTWHAADRSAPAETHTGHGHALPTGAGTDASATSASGVTATTAGLGAASGGADLLVSDDTGGKRYAKAPIDEGA